MSKTNKVLASMYIDGSDGYQRLFTRAKGTEYWKANRKQGVVASRDLIVMQWDGTPTVDSGYSS